MPYFDFEVYPPVLVFHSGQAIFIDEFLKDVLDLDVDAHIFQVLHGCVKKDFFRSKAENFVPLQETTLLRMSLMSSSTAVFVPVTLR